MSFFKVDTLLVSDHTDETNSVPKTPKLRYVIDEDGKGHWVKPICLYPTDYDEFIDY